MKEMGRWSWLGGFAGAMLAVSAFAQAPKNAVPQSKAGEPPAAPVESSQNIWDDDVERVSEEIRKLRLKLQVKENQRRAIQAYIKGDYGSVRALVPEILKLDPAAIEAEEYLAIADWQAGDQAKAMAGYDRAIEKRRKQLEGPLTPAERRDAVKHLAVTLGNRGVARSGRDPQGAIEDFDEALENKTPLAATITWQKSQSLSALKRYEEAASLLEAAVAMDPRLKARGMMKFPDPTARNLCQVLAANGQTVQACN